MPFGARTDTSGRRSSGYGWLGAPTFFRFFRFPLVSTARACYYSGMVAVKTLRQSNKAAWQRLTATMLHAYNATRDIGSVILMAGPFLSPTSSERADLESLRGGSITCVGSLRYRAADYQCTGRPVTFPRTWWCRNLPPMRTGNNLSARAKTSTSWGSLGSGNDSVAPARYTTRTLSHSR